MDPAAPQPPDYETPDPERPASAAPTEADLEREVPTVPALDYVPPPREHDPYAALRFADYRKYIVGWILAVVGQQMQSVAVGWEIFDKTKSKLALGLVGLVGALPVILLALPAGHVADMFDRRRIVAVSLSTVALCSVGLAIASLLHPSMGDAVWLAVVYGLLLVSATGAALGWPARSAVLPQTVPTWAFANAMTWNATFFETSAAVGPAIGGWIIIKAVWPAYALNALCALSFATAVMLLPRKQIVAKREPPSLQSLAAGVRFVWSQKIILATITLDLFAVLLGGATYILPVFAKDILHCGSVGFGWLRASPGIGAVTMAMLLAHLPPMRRAGATLLWAVAGFGVATIIFAVSKNFWLSMAMLILTGAFDNISVVVRHTLVQVLTPDSMRGRVSAVNNVFIGASNEIGGFESGLAAQLMGTVPSVVFGGIGTIVVVILTALKWPQVRQFGSLHDAKPIEDPESTLTAAGDSQREPAKSNPA
jgi:MFS family permease